MKRINLITQAALIAFCVFTSFVTAKNLKDTTTIKSNYKMNNEKLNGIITSIAEVIKSSKGHWEIKYKSFYVIIVTDENHNRMRIISAVSEEKKLKQKDLQTVLSANFDRALDAKYAIYNGYLWSVFTHPLAELQEDQFKDTLLQVVTLANNFGTSYSSTDLIFGGQK